MEGNGITYESDAKHRVELMRRLNLEEDSKGTTSAGIRKDEEKEEELEIQLEGEERKGFRGEIALLNYLGQDRSDLQYATNQISRGMANPTEAGRRRIKKNSEASSGGNASSVAVWGIRRGGKQEADRRTC